MLIRARNRKNVLYTFKQCDICSRFDTLVLRSSEERKRTKTCDMCGAYFEFCFAQQCVDFPIHTRRLIALYTLRWCTLSLSLSFSLGCVGVRSNPSVASRTESNTFRYAVYKHTSTRRVSMYWKIRAQLSLTGINVIPSQSEQLCLAESL